MEDGKLARRKVELVTIQGNYAIIKKSEFDDMKIITTILQKPLLGMRVASTNESIEIKEEVSNVEDGEQNLISN
jgi:hypothetical protein